MDEEPVHGVAVHRVVHSDEKRREYRRKWMVKRRMSERAMRVAMSAQKGDIVGALESVVGGGAVPAEMTDTDRKFEEAIQGYWIYGEELIRRECWKCGERFETRLEMNKFCSPKCKEGWLTEAFGKLRQNEKST